MLEALTEVPLGLLDLFGVAGAALYICNYTLLVTRRTSADRPLYFVVNLSAAIFLLISLSQAFNLGAALIQLFFCAMSVVGIVSRLHPLRQLRRPLLVGPQSIRWSQPGLDRERL